MFYPAYVEMGDKNTAFAAVLPDFPGCYTAVDNLDDLPKAVQESVELYFDGEGFDLPHPSSLPELIKRKAEYDYEGVWMMFQIDTSKLQTRSKRINITFPENLLCELDSKAKTEHLSRSGYLQKLVFEDLNEPA